MKELTYHDICLVKSYMKLGYDHIAIKHNSIYYYFDFSSESWEYETFLNEKDFKMCSNINTIILHKGGN